MPDTAHFCTKCGEKVLLMQPAASRQVNIDNPAVAASAPDPALAAPAAEEQEPALSAEEREEIEIGRKAVDAGNQSAGRARADDTNWIRLVGEFANSTGEKRDMAFTRLYEASYERIYGYAYSYTRDEDRANEATQKAFIACWEKIDQLDSANRFIPWMKTIVYNAFCGDLRKNKRIDQFAVVQDDEGNETSAEEFLADDTMMMPENGLADTELHNLLIGTLQEELSEEDRTIFMRHYFEGVQLKDIAAEMDMSENTVKTRVRRGRQKLLVKVSAYANAYGLKLVPVAIIPFMASLSKVDAQACEISAVAAAGSGTVLVAVKSAVAAHVAAGAGTTTVAGAGAGAASAAGSAAGSAGVAGTGAAAGSAGAASTAAAGTAGTAAAGSTAAASTAGTTAATGVAGTTTAAGSATATTAAGSAGAAGAGTAGAAGTTGAATAGAAGGAGSAAAVAAGAVGSGIAVKAGVGIVAAAVAVGGAGAAYVHTHQRLDPASMTPKERAEAMFEEYVDEEDLAANAELVSAVTYGDNGAAVSEDYEGDAGIFAVLYRDLDHDDEEELVMLERQPEAHDDSVWHIRLVVLDWDSDKTVITRTQELGTINTSSDGEDAQGFVIFYKDGEYQDEILCQHYWNYYTRYSGFQENIAAYRYVNEQISEVNSFRYEGADVTGYSDGGEQSFTATDYSGRLRAMGLDTSATRLESAGQLLPQNTDAAGNAGAYGSFIAESEEGLTTVLELYTTYSYNNVATYRGYLETGSVPSRDNMTRSIQFTIYDRESEIYSAR